MPVPTISYYCHRGHIGHRPSAPRLYADLGSAGFGAGPAGPVPQGLHTDTKNDEKKIVGDLTAQLKRNYFKMMQK